LYEDQRKSSDKHAEKRSKYFEEAEEAFASGDHEKAKKLREKAKQEGEKMEKSKKKAAEKIFKKKNASHDPTSIDLHGLQTDEALAQLTSRFELLSTKHKNVTELSVVTGAGIHSAAGAKIKPAVEEYLKEKGYSYTTQNNGTLLVTLS